jgi:hypothetical protein
LRWIREPERVLCEPAHGPPHWRCEPAREAIGCRVRVEWKRKDQQCAAEHCEPKSEPTPDAPRDCTHVVAEGIKRGTRMVRVVITCRVVAGCTDRCTGAVQARHRPGAAGLRRWVLHGPADEGRRDRATRPDDPRRHHSCFAVRAIRLLNALAMWPTSTIRSSSRIFDWPAAPRWSAWYSSLASAHARPPRR